jgi:hypothetical protein
LSKPTPWFGPFPEIHVICTNRKQHPPMTLEWLTDQRGTDPPGPIVPSGTTSRVSRRTGRQVVIDRPSPVSMLRNDGSRTFTFRCRHPQCVPPRNVQRRMEKLGAQLDLLYALFPADQRRYTLDISYMG